MSDWDFKVRGVAGPKFSSWCRDGDVIVETVHRGVTSAEMEVSAWQSRMRDGEDIARIELIDLRRGFSDTNLNIGMNTKIDWRGMYARSMRV